jgi:hypothetical protein
MLWACVPPPAAATDPAEPGPAATAEPGEPAEAGATGEGGEFELVVLRQFDMFGETIPDGGGSQHGDYVAYGPCGSLYLARPREAIFIVCNGQVAAGPITDLPTARQAIAWLRDQAMAIMSRQNDMSAAGHELSRSVRATWPCGGTCKTNVYDSSGNLVRTY